MPTTNRETIEQFGKRCEKLNATAGELSKKSEKASRDAFAAAFMFACEHGETRYLNELHNVLSNHDKYAMRAFGLKRVHEHFALQVMPVEEDDEGNKVVKAQNIPFILKYSAANGGSYSLAKLKGENPDYEGDQLKYAKAIKAAIRKAGEDAVASIEWMTEKEASTLAAPFTLDKANNGLRNLLVKVAKSPRLEKSWDSIKATAKAFGLTQDDVDKIKAAYDEAREAPTAANKPEETEQEQKAA